MSFLDRLPTLSTPALHAIHILLFALTTLFLLLPAITGPATKFWWLAMTLPVPASAGVGSQWHLGGLGVCKVGEECLKNAQNVPELAGQVKSTLIYHFAVAGMFTVIALIEFGLIARPGSRPICSAWTTLALLVAGPLVNITAMMVDLIVRAELSKKDTIENVKTEPSFWLSVMAACTSILWSLAVYRVRQIKYDGTAATYAAAEKEARRERRAKEAKIEAQQEQYAARRAGLRGLWPW